MAKGKRFDAAEKHFAKERDKYLKCIKSLEQQLENAHNDTRLYRTRSELYERENEELKNWIERLLEYTELSKEDIKAACEKDKRLAEAARWLTQFSNIF